MPRVRQYVVALLIVTMMPIHLFAAGTADDTASLERIQRRLATPSLLPAMPVGAAAQAQTAPCESSRAIGNTAANDQHGAAGWFLGGVGAGVALGLIGTGIITGGSALTNPQPRTTPDGVDESCYRDGYRGRAKNRNVLSSLFGGLVGTGAWLAIYIARNN